MTSRQENRASVACLLCLVLLFSSCSPAISMEDAGPTEGDQDYYGEETRNSRTQRVVIAEFFTAVWGSDTQDARRALDLAMGEFEESRVVCVAYHHDIGDPLGIKEGMDRYQSYGVWSIPTVGFDGVDFGRGPPGGAALYQYYCNEIQSNLQVPANVSIKVQSTISTNGLGIVSVNVSKGQNMSSSEKVLRLAIIEDDVSSGTGTYDQVARRMLPSASGTLLDLQNKSSDDVTFRFETDPGWVVPNLRCVVWVQDKNQTPVYNDIHYTSQIHGALRTEFELVDNHRPFLQNGSASPSTVFEGEEIEFRVLLRDDDDTRPWYVRLRLIGDTGYESWVSMNEVAFTGDWIVGHWFNWSGALPRGNYRYRFTAFDGQYSAWGDMGWHFGIWVRPVGPPFQLRNPYHAPDDGDPATVFKFEIEYRHDVELLPSRAVVNLDGTERDLQRNETQLEDGWWTYYYETTLPDGDDHWYFFLFDVQGDIKRFPGGDQRLKGPRVRPVDLPPLLSEAKVTPLAGTRLDLYTFHVEYYDPEGEPPVSALTVVDGQRYEMTPMGVTSGNRTAYKVIMTLGLGEHNHSYQFTDGTHDVRLPETGVFMGPRVVNLPPVAVIGQPRVDTVNHGTPVTFSAAGSHDPEGDNLTVSWVLEGPGPQSNGWSFNKSFEEGEHTVTLTVTDEHGGSSSTSRTLKVLPGEPEVEIGSLSLGPDGAVAGETITISTQVSHHSGRELTGEVAHLIIDDAVVGTRTVDLSRGGTTSIVFEWEAIEGEHVLVISLLNRSVQDTLHVLPNSPPVVTLRVDTPEDNWRVDDPMSMMASASDPDGHDLTYRWVVDGYAIPDTGDVHDHTFTSGGRHSVTVFVKDELGLENSTTLELQVKDDSEPSNDWRGGYLLVLLLVAAVLMTVVFLTVTKLWKRDVR